VGVLADLRADVAAALTKAVGKYAWQVYPLPVESPTPPCFMLLWGEPWLEGPTTPCLYVARLEVRIIGGRIEPDTGIETLEVMVEAAAHELDKARHPMRTLTRPAPYTINNVHYQSAVAALTHNVNATNAGGS
jgi:hypothetical protein